MTLELSDRVTADLGFCKRYGGLRPERLGFCRASSRSALTRTRSTSPVNPDSVASEVRPCFNGWAIRNQGSRSRSSPEGPVAHSNAQVGTDMHDVGFDERQVGADMDDVGLGEREVGADAHDT